MKRLFNITANTLLVLVSSGFLCTNVAFAQQDPNFTQYMYNTLTINPAYAGTRDVWSTGLLYRSQWTGIEGSPRTATFSTHTPVKDGKVGLGMNIIHDEIGPQRDTHLNFNYSYIIDVSRYSKLSMGLSAGGRFIDVDFNRLSIFDPTDTSFGNVRNNISPQVGVGFQLYSDRYYIGLSAPFLLRTRFDDGDPIESALRDELHYYLTAGYVFDLSREVQFKPSIMTRAVQGAPLRVDLSANFLFYEKFTLGAAYRLDAAVSAMAGFQISDALLFGVAYDYTVSEFSELRNPSFEAFLRYELFKKYKKMYTPRFF